MADRPGEARPDDDAAAAIRAGLDYGGDYMPDSVVRGAALAAVGRLVAERDALKEEQAVYYAQAEKLIAEANELRRSRDHESAVSMRRLHRMLELEAEQDAARENERRCQENRMWASQMIADYKEAAETAEAERDELRARLDWNADGSPRNPLPTYDHEWVSGIINKNNRRGRALAQLEEALRELFDFAPDYVTAGLRGWTMDHARWREVLANAAAALAGGTPPGEQADAGDAGGVRVEDTGLSGDSE